MRDDSDGRTRPGLTPEQQRAVQQRLEKGLKALPGDVTELWSALQDGADANCPVFGGSRSLLPLHIAIEKKSTEAIDVLVAYGAEVNGVDADGETALDKAIRARSDEAIRFIRDFDGKTRRELDTDGEIIFSYQEKMSQSLFAVFINHAGRYEQVRASLARGADPDAQNRGHSLLHRSVVRLDLEMVGLLLDAGADIHRRSGDGQSQLDLLWACHYRDLLTPGWYKMLDFLEEKGCHDFFSGSRKK